MILLACMRLAEFGDVGGAYIAVRCATDPEPLTQQAGGRSEPGSRRWRIHSGRIKPLIRALRCGLLGGAWPELARDRHSERGERPP
jgi:hypothetical protein